MSKRLGVSQRHLNRVLVAEVGATAQQLAQSRRAHTARALMDQTGWQLADIAFAAGFGSVRQFNAVMRAEFGAAPSRLRRASAVERHDGGRCRLVLVLGRLRVMRCALRWPPTSSLVWNGRWGTA